LHSGVAAATCFINFTGTKDARVILGAAVDMLETQWLDHCESHDGYDPMAQRRNVTYDVSNMSDGGSFPEK